MQYRVTFKQKPDGSQPDDKFIEADHFDVGPSGSLSFFKFEQLQSNEMSHVEELTHYVCSFSHGCWDAVLPGHMI